MTMWCPALCPARRTTATGDTYCIRRRIGPRTRPIFGCLARSAGPHPVPFGRSDQTGRFGQLRKPRASSTPESTTARTICLCTRRGLCSLSERYTGKTYPPGTIWISRQTLSASTGARYATALGQRKGYIWPSARRCTSVERTWGTTTVTVAPAKRCSPSASGPMDWQWFPSLALTDPLLKVTVKTPSQASRSRAPPLYPEEAALPRVEFDAPSGSDPRAGGGAVSEGSGSSAAAPLRSGGSIMQNANAECIMKVSPSGMNKKRVTLSHYLLSCVNDVTSS